MAPGISPRRLLFALSARSRDRECRLSIAVNAIKIGKQTIHVQRGVPIYFVKNK